MKRCYSYLRADNATYTETEEPTETQSELTDDHYKLFEAIITENIQEFLRITNTPEFNINYLIGFLSPLLVAELFPHPIILKKLDALNAKIMPIGLIKHDWPQFNETRRIYEHQYIKESIQSVKSSSILAEAIAKHLLHEAKFYVNDFSDQGILHNKPFANIISNFIKNGLSFASSNVRSYINLDQRISYTASREFGKHSVEILTVLLKSNVNNWDFCNSLGPSYTAPMYWCALSAGNISIHLLRPFLAAYPDLLRSYANYIHVNIANLPDSINLDGLGELITQFPDNKELMNNVVKKIITSIRHDSTHSNHLVFVHLKIVIKILLTRYKI